MGDLGHDGGVCEWMMDAGAYFSAVQSGKVYLIETGGELRIKRLFKRANGWVVASDNQDKIRYPDEPLNALNDIRIIGRIVWRGGRL